MNKRTRLLLTAFMMLSIFTTVQANNTLTLYDDGESSTTAPINNAYLDEVGTRTQVIYPAQDITAMYGEVINSVTFYTYNPISVEGGEIEVSIGETSQNEFSGAGSYVEGLTHVATISMINGATEIEIVFDTPFYYHGGNFVIETLVTEATDYCYVTFMGSRPQIYTAMTRNEVERFLPKTTFNYGTMADYSAKVMPDELTFNTIRAERTDSQSITLINNGQMEFAPTFSVDAPFIVNIADTVLPAGASMEVPVIFAPQAEGTYTATLSIDCGEAGIVEATLHGTAIAAAEDLLVGDETDYASFVPIYGADIDIVDTRGQMIYNANLLTDMAGSDIVALQFHVKDKVKMEGGVIQLSLKEVEDSIFRSRRIVTDLTAVATLTPVYDGTEFAFTFDEPFRYNGGNLLVECLVIEAGTTHYRQTFFWGTPTSKSVSIYTSMDYGSMVTEFVPFMPEVTFSYQKEKAQVLRGDVNNDGIVNISDVTALINYVLSGHGDINTANADINDDQNVNISDVTLLINMVMTSN
ncbi:MAG: hypothetical protein IJG42_11665 [Muribaculaceae bacterium]|nr:hypothetical protein [Muribaculaceae bacterium]